MVLLKCQDESLTDSPIEWNYPSQISIYTFVSIANVCPAMFALLLDFLFCSNINRTIASQKELTVWLNRKL